MLIQQLYNIGKHNWPKIMLWIFFKKLNWLNFGTFILNILIKIKLIKNADFSHES